MDDKIELTTMRLSQFQEILRDAEVAYAIGPIVRKHQLDVEQTAGLLQDSGVPRAQNVAKIVFDGSPGVVSSKL
jgi:hypothetical protein